MGSNERREEQIVRNNPLAAGARSGCGRGEILDEAQPNDYTEPVEAAGFVTTCGVVAVGVELSTPWIAS